MGAFKIALIYVYRWLVRESSLIGNYLNFGKGIDFIDSELGIYNGLEEDHFVGYEQSNLLFNNPIKKYINISSAKKDSVLDIGCGKGRMLYYFYKLGFTKTDGIEYSRELCSVARNNYEIIRKRKK
ncbi:MAG: class I SAM-dependent methyltransferase [Butyrivibrio sp.]|uniref:class I SAM-dependent methyltransferase n=1 Tax=Butyrivibrio sp. TaxID=28121 RepID=UPI0025BA87F8|nr:class I SAM-dependent methyltransferase [Butyrivibrio sp.]MBQ6587220.1 class I SAM-dependent methyltransferase [Butyrivibrio sp.]